MKVTNTDYFTADKINPRYNPNLLHIATLQDGDKTYWVCGNLADKISAYYLRYNPIEGLTEIEEDNEWNEVNSFVSDIGLSNLKAVYERLFDTQQFNLLGLDQ